MNHFSARNVIRADQEPIIIKYDLDALDLVDMITYKYEIGE